MFTDTTSRLNRSVFACMTFVAALVFAGCGGGSKGGGDNVSGKVTFDGKPVAGQVVFVGSDRKEYPSPIGPEGNYQIIGAPKGEFTILVKGTLGAAPTAKGGAKTPDMPGMTGVAGIAPPVKYATAAGGLKLTVTGGNQKYDITLTP